jgi:hypothetical protein
LARIKADLSKWEQEMKFLVVNERMWTGISSMCNVYLQKLKMSQSAIEEEAFGKLKKLESEECISDLFIKQLMT